MKIIEGNRFILEVDSNKPFSIFGVSDILYYNSSLDEQIIELFENTPTDFGDKINSGERIIMIRTNSEEERYELSYLFIHEGFKIRSPQKIIWCEEYEYKRKYFTEESLNKYEELYPESFISFFNLYLNEFKVYLKKRDTKKFLNFLKTLSSEHGYKTLYRDKNISRHYLRCCDEKSNNYKMKYKLL